MDYQEYKKQLLKNLPDTIKEEEVDEYIFKIKEEKIKYLQIVRKVGNGTNLY